MKASKALTSDTTALTTVTKDNFLDYFSLNGSASYDKTSGIVTITPDKNNQVGNFALNSKIDMQSSFTLTGSVNLGNRTSSQGGADGIGFAFHNGNTTDIGNAGGNLGIGGLLNAIGFKLDTYNNQYQTPQASVPGAQVSATDSNGFGWSYDPDGTNYPQYGSFVTTSDEQIKAKNGNYYQRWWATTDMGSVQKLNSADLDGQFHNFVVSYDGSSRLLTINYTEANGKTLTWTKTVDSSYKAMALIVSASTGGSKNLQQFKIDSFKFHQAATVNVKYVDTKGNTLATSEVDYPDGPYKNASYATKKLTISNYKFIKMGDNDTTGKSIAASGTLSKSGENGTVVYVYAPISQTTKTVNETIKYVNQSGTEVATSYKAQPITFVTITNSADNSSEIYYSTTATTAELDADGVPTGTAWTKANSAAFAEVANPVVGGYQVISNDAPASDLTKVANQTVNNKSGDLAYTVVYAPAYTQASKTVNETIKYVDQAGKEVAKSATATPITFVTVTNPVDKTTTTYYSTTATTTTLDKNGVPTEAGWTKADSADFAEVANPVVAGYQVISNDAPDHDLTKVSAQTVNSTSEDLAYTVVYAPAYTQASKTVNEAIKYVDQAGKAVATGYTAKPINFVTVTNPVDGSQTVYYSTTATTAELDENGVPTGTAWAKADSAAFAEVANPVVDGYKVISNDAPDHDLTKVSAQTVNSTSEDLAYTVVYAPVYTQSSKTVNETIKYVDQAGKEVAKSATATPITFVTVTNPVDKTTTTYYSTTATTAELDENGVPTGTAWTKANSAAFAEVANPVVDGYKVISNDAPASDLAKVANQTVNSTSKDLAYTVVYAPAYTQASKTVNETIKYVDQAGKAVATSYTATPITFVTITNPVDGSQTV
ncbi:lectin-like domain-containing protein, partial [Liquorilactobacillus uvarum]